MRIPKKWLVLAVGVFGCASHAPEIKSEWVARVPPERMGPIEHARQENRRAEHEMARSKLLVDDAKRARSVEESELSAAQSQLAAANKSVEAAELQGNGLAITDARAKYQKAQQDLDRARDRLASSRTRIEYSESRRQLAEARLARTSAEVNRAEYQVLHGLGDTRVQELQPTDFDQHVNKLAEKEASLRQKAEQKRIRLEESQRRLSP
ncbi:MAG: hypothetical protein ACT4TC_13495 [Myxococcaceae bacterium]